jgi:hypothetical protein
VEITRLGTGDSMKIEDNKPGEVIQREVEITRLGRGDSTRSGDNKPGDR